MEEQLKQILPPQFTVLWKSRNAAEVLSSELQHRCRKILFESENFFFVENEESGMDEGSLSLHNCYFWRSHWPKAQIASIESIGQAAQFLKKSGPLWVPFIHKEVRRTHHIAETLRSPMNRTYEFGKYPPQGNLGGFSLMSKSEVLFCPVIQPGLRSEWIDFEESEEAPSRAYLKLWELFLLLRKAPKSGSKVVDFGSSPGGWTWVLRQLGCQVTSIDKAALAPELMKDKAIRFEAKDVFQIKQEQFPEMDWIFSDMIAYPDKLFEFFQPWIASKKAKNFVITLKFKGTTDFQALDRWLSIPGSQCYHLQANKHELTWVLFLD